MMATKRKRGLKNTLVQYKGGGNDGNFWQYNYSYIDSNGEYHVLGQATGPFGCPNFDKFKRELANRPKDFTLIRLETERTPKLIAEFVERTGWSHVIGLARECRELEVPVTIEVTCGVCGEKFDAADAEGVGSHGVGGIMSDFNGVACPECYSNGTCSYCGEYVGADDIVHDTDKQPDHIWDNGYCKWCAESQAEKWQVAQDNAEYERKRKEWDRLQQGLPPKE